MRKQLIIFLKGCAMGFADILPGISGGTIAFILGIYEELINAIKDFLAFKPEFTKLSFLLPLTLGIASAFLISSRVVSLLLATQKQLMYALFAGLISGSALLLFKKFKFSSKKSIASFSLGFMFSVLFSIFATAQLALQHSPAMSFISGFFASSAMLLPGISGAFVLLFLGQYHFLLNALVQWNMPHIVAFIFGALLGIAFLSRIIAFALKKARNEMLAFLCALMLGSLARPLAIASSASMFAILSFFSGFFVVFVLHHFGKIKTPKK